MGTSSHEHELRHTRRPLPAIAGIAATALLAACGASATGGAAGSSVSSSGPASATPAATSSVSCAQVIALRTALTKLSTIRVNAKTGSQVSADLTNTENAATALKDEASSAFSAEASQVSAALAMIGKHVRELSSHPTPANLRATTTAITELKTAVGPAITIMRTVCAS
jgi:anti-sigma factor RsiW